MPALFLCTPCQNMRSKRGQKYQPDLKIVIANLKNSRDEDGPDGWGARLPFRWPQGETGKIPAFSISVLSG